MYGAAAGQRIPQGVSRYGESRRVRGAEVVEYGICVSEVPGTIRSETTRECRAIVCLVKTCDSKPLITPYLGRIVGNGVRLFHGPGPEFGHADDGIKQAELDTAIGHHRKCEVRKLLCCAR